MPRGGPRISRARRTWRRELRSSSRLRTSCEDRPTRASRMKALDAGAPLGMAWRAIAASLDPGSGRACAGAAEDPPAEGPTGCPDFATAARPSVRAPKPPRTRFPAVRSTRLTWPRCGGRGARAGAGAAACALPCCAMSASRAFAFCCTFCTTQMTPRNTATIRKMTTYWLMDSLRAG